MNLPRRVLVTGGGTGLGLGIVEALLYAGTEVVAVGRRAEPLTAAAALGARTFPYDVTEDPDQLLDLAGPLDGLVHNAAVYVHGAHDQWRAEDWRRQWQINVLAPAMLSRAFVARSTGPGAIVAISSTLARRPAIGATPYATTKAALIALVQGLALELGPRRIRVNAVLPGVVPTPMTDAPRGEIDPAVQTTGFAQLHALGRMGTPAEVAEVVLTALGNPWMTGAALTIDGGLSIK